MSYNPRSPRDPATPSGFGLSAVIRKFWTVRGAYLKLSITAYLFLASSNALSGWWLTEWAWNLTEKQIAGLPPINVNVPIPDPASVAPGTSLSMVAYGSEDGLPGAFGWAYSDGRPLIENPNDPYRPQLADYKYDEPRYSCDTPIPLDKRIQGNSGHTVINRRIQIEARRDMKVEQQVYTTYVTAGNLISTGQDWIVNDGVSGVNENTNPGGNRRLTPEQRAEWHNRAQLIISTSNPPKPTVVDLDAVFGNGSGVSSAGQSQPAVSTNLVTDLSPPSTPGKSSRFDPLNPFKQSEKVNVNHVDNNPRNFSRAKLCGGSTPGANLKAGLKSSGRDLFTILVIAGIKHYVQTNHPDSTAAKSWAAHEVEQDKWSWRNLHRRDYSNEDVLYYYEHGKFPEGVPKLSAFDAFASGMSEMSLQVN